jgi:hypothetical protein
MSSDGSSNVYKADDHLTVPDSEKNKAAGFEKDKERSHRPHTIMQLEFPEHEGQLK